MEGTIGTSRRLGPAPLALFALMVPGGLSAGFTSVTLPFALTRGGFTVADTASIVAIGLAGNVFRFLWGPVTDLTWTLHRWYAVALCACALTLASLGFLPLVPELSAAIFALTFASQVAGALTAIPVFALASHTVPPERQGRAAGWYQAGSLTGTGLGGGAGVWLADRHGFRVAAIVLAIVATAAVGALRFVPDVRARGGGSVGRRLGEMVRDLRDVLRTRVGRFTILVFLAPMGVGAAANIWAAVASDWSASPDDVAFASGAASGVVTAAGALVGGRIADRVGRWGAFFGVGAALAVVALIMAAAPRTPASFVVGVLAYALVTGGCFAAFSVVMLHVVGDRSACTRYGVLNSLGNVPVAYMTALLGWAHDRVGSSGMLVTEAVTAFACILVLVVALWRVRGLRDAILPLERTT